MSELEKTNEVNQELQAAHFELTNFESEELDEGTIVLCKTTGGASLFPGNVSANETDIYVEMTVVFNTAPECGGQTTETYTSAVARINCSNLGASCCP